MAKKLAIYDRRMIELMGYIRTISKYKVSTQSAFLSSIGIVSVNNLKYIRDGKTSFTMKQYMAAINKYGINPAFFFDELEPMFKKDKATPIQQLKDAVRIVEKAMISR